MAARWETGEVIVRREVLGLAPGFHPDPPPRTRPRAALGEDLVGRLEAGEQLWDDGWSR